MLRRSRATAAVHDVGVKNEDRANAAAEATAPIASPSQVAEPYTRQIGKNCARVGGKALVSRMNERRAGDFEAAGASFVAEGRSIMLKLDRAPGSVVLQCSDPKERVSVTSRWMTDASGRGGEPDSEAVPPAAQPCIRWCGPHCSDTESP